MTDWASMADRNLSQAADTLNAMNGKTLPAAQIQAEAARAQVGATIAVAQAILHLADTIKEQRS